MFRGISDFSVTLSGKTANDTFRGFFIQPRTDVNTYATVGTFPDTTPKTRNPCSASGVSVFTAFNLNIVLSNKYLTLVLLHPDMPFFANSVDPDQLASEEAN